VPAAGSLTGALPALSPDLKRVLSERSQSFVVLPAQANGAIFGVLGFIEPDPPFADAPDEIVEKLNLIGWASWSVAEMARLRGELRTVNERLAGRKLVERAKSALQAERSISEEQAYAYLRRLSRKRRISLAQISSEIVRSPQSYPAA
jgi:hypothetical protein